MNNASSTRTPLQGNKIGMAIEELHRSENDLAGALLNLSDQQKINHEIFYVARDIARWSQEHVRRTPRSVSDMDSTSTRSRRTNRRYRLG